MSRDQRVVSYGDMVSRRVESDRLYVHRVVPVAAAAARREDLREAVSSEQQIDAHSIRVVTE